MVVCFPMPGGEDGWSRSLVKSATLVMITANKRILMRFPNMVCLFRPAAGADFRGHDLAAILTCRDDLSVPSQTGVERPSPLPGENRASSCLCDNQILVLLRIVLP